MEEYKYPLVELSDRDFNFKEINLKIWTVYDSSNNLWVLGSDFAVALGYKQPADAIYRIVPKECTFSVIYRKGSQLVKAILINEPGMYFLIGSSKLPNAMEFKYWLYSEVLPSIRKTGAYVEPDLTQYYLEHPEQSPEFFQEQLNLRNQEIANLERQLGKTQNKLKMSRATQKTIERDYKNYRKENETYINSIQPQLNYYNEVLDSSNTYTTTEVAKTFGLTAQQLNEYLCRKGVQFKGTNCYFLYDNYTRLGLEKMRICKGDYIELTWTNKGMYFISCLLKEDGII